MTKISGLPGTVRSGSTITLPARSAAAPSHSAAGEAATPAAQRIVRAGSTVSPKTTPSASQRVTARPSSTVDAKPLQRLPGIVGKFRREIGKDAVAGLDQHHARLARVDVAELAAQRVAREFGNGAGQFHAGRPAADDRQRQQRLALLRIGFPLGLLEGQQDAPPNGGGVLERLQPGRERLPFVMAEIGVAGAGGEHQRVVGDRAAVVEQHALAGAVDATDIGEQRRHVLALAQEMADRPGNLRGRQRRGRHLIEQWLEKMVVALVDHGDADRRT